MNYNLKTFFFMIGIACLVAASVAGKGRKPQSRTLINAAAHLQRRYNRGPYIYVFACSLVSGRSRAKGVRWYRKDADGGKVYLDPKIRSPSYRIRHMGRVLLLRANDDSPSNATSYICEAGGMKIEYHVPLQQIGPAAAPESSTVTQTAAPGPTLPAGRRPTWAQPGHMTKKLHVEPQGNDFRLRCYVRGQPTPEVVWYKDGDLIRDGDMDGGFKWRQNSQMMILESVTPAYGGEYECKASNMHGSISHTFELAVGVRASSRPILKQGFPSNKTVFADQDEVTFKCMVTNGNAHVEWLKIVSEEQIDSIPIAQKLNSSSENGYQVLRLLNVAVADAGQYICLAGNAMGISHRSAWLKVIAPDH